MQFLALCPIVSRTILAIILLRASLPKILQLSSFVETVRSFEVAPSALSRPIAFTVVAWEIATATALLFGPPILPDILAVLLVTCFAMAILINLLRGRRDLNCGCFGAKQSEPISWRSLIRNIAMLAAAVFPLAVVGMSKQGSPSAVDMIAAKVVVFGLSLCLSTLQAIGGLRRHSLAGHLFFGS